MRLHGERGSLLGLIGRSKGLILTLLKGKLFLLLLDKVALISVRNLSSLQFGVLQLLLILVCHLPGRRSD